MKTLAASLSILTREGVMLYLLRGVAFTCIISVLGVIMGLIVGSLLALARTYCKKGPTRILGWFATAYIELFRNTPYLLWIFICVVFCPCPDFFARKMFGLTSVEMKLLFKAALALILFNSSVIAEIVRGGLNGVSKGQFEAGYAQGFNTAEVLLYIVLPQAYRNIVPTLLSQVITIINSMFDLYVTQPGTYHLTCGQNALVTCPNVTILLDSAASGESSNVYLSAKADKNVVIANDGGTEPTHVSFFATQKGENAWTLRGNVREDMVRTRTLSQSQSFDGRYAAGFGLKSHPYLITTATPSLPI
mgnify:CR=1 FL=1